MQTRFKLLWVAIVVIVLVLMLFSLVVNILDEVLGLSLGAVAIGASSVFWIIDKSGVIHSIFSAVRKSSPKDERVTQRLNQPQKINDYLTNKIRGFQDNQTNSFIPMAYSTGSLSASKVRHNREFSSPDEVYKQYKQFVFIGHPGVGKSVVMQELFKHLAELHLDPDAKQPIPLWIDLSHPNNPVDIYSLLKYWWETLYDLESSFDQMFLTRPPVIFLDGLNEMPLESRNQRASSLRSWIWKNPNIRVIMSCRTRDYEDDKSLNMGEHFPIVNVEPFERDQIKSFLESTVRYQVQGLMKRIDEDDAIFRLAQIPLHLSMLAILAKKDGYMRLPNRLLDLYNNYLEQRYVYEKASKGNINLEWEKLSTELKKLAYAMNEVLSLPASKAQWKIGRKAMADAFSLSILVRTKDNDTTKKSWFGNSTDIVRFYHQSLHGYFALPKLIQDIKVLERLSNQIWLPKSLYNLFVTRHPDAIIRQIGDLGDTAEIAVETLAPLLGSNVVQIRLATQSALIDIGVSSIRTMIEILRKRVKKLQPLYDQLERMSQDVEAHKQTITELKQEQETIEEQIKEEPAEPQMGKLRSRLAELKRKINTEETKYNERNQAFGFQKKKLDKILDGDKVATAARHVLSEIGKPVIGPLLLYVLNMKSTVADEQVFAIFSKMKPEKGPKRELVTAMKNRKENPTTFKEYVIEELGDIRSSRAVEPMLEMLRNSDGDVRAEVLIAILKINERTDILSIVIQPIMEILKTEKHHAAFRNAALVMVRLGDDALQEFVVQLRKARHTERERLEQAVGIMVNRDVRLYQAILNDVNSSKRIEEVAQRMYHNLQVRV
jgi:hypothetical protein